jgi:hypothetical protein
MLGKRPDYHIEEDNVIPILVMSYNFFDPVPIHPDLT